MSKIFVSYRRGDSADVTGRVDDRLVDAFGRENVFKDIDSIPLGVDFRVHLSDAVGSCDLVLVVMGEGWIGAEDVEGNRRLEDDADFVRIEVESALQRNIPVVPVLLGNAEMPKPNELPASMQELCFRNATKVRSDPDFTPDMTRIIDGIKKSTGQAAAATKKAPSATSSAKAPTISVTCQCGKTLRAKKEMAGRKAKCPACGSPLQIPAAKQPPKEAVPPQPTPSPAVAPTPERQAPLAATPQVAAATPSHAPDKKRSIAMPLIIGAAALFGVVALGCAGLIGLSFFGSTDDDIALHSANYRPEDTSSGTGTQSSIASSTDTATTTLNIGTPDKEPWMFWNTKKWNALSKDEQACFATLGWDGAMWDDYKFGDGVDDPDSEYNNWDEMSSDERAALIKLGWNKEWWFLYQADTRSPGDADPYTFWNDKRDKLTEDEQKLIAMLNWSPDLDEFSQLDEKDWDEMTVFERAALETLGFTRQSWDD